MDVTSPGVGAENAIGGPTKTLSIGGDLQVLWALSPQGVVCGPVAASPGSLLEMQNLGLHPKPAESESAF